MTTQGCSASGTTALGAEQQKWKWKEEVAGFCQPRAVPEHAQLVLRGGGPGTQSRLWEKGRLGASPSLCLSFPSAHGAKDPDPAFEQSNRARGQMAPRGNPGALDPEGQSPAHQHSGARIPGASLHAPVKQGPAVTLQAPKSSQDLVPDPALGKPGHTAGK